MQRYRLADADLTVPMPERGRDVFFTADPAGESVNPLDPYYARMIASGELVPAETLPTDMPAFEVQPARKKRL